MSNENDKIELTRIQEIIVNKDKQILGIICVMIGFVLGLIFGIKVV